MLGKGTTLKKLSKYVVKIRTQGVTKISPSLMLGEFGWP
jgi:hypothetical protein